VKRRVMFVDDEPRVLQGLRRMLRSMSSEWEMFFCEGGEQALEQLGRQPVDVLVSDIRMPKVDGVQLFAQVRANYPDTVRIALSGQTSEEALLRTVGTVHQFLSKPCDAQVLRSTVTRICALQEMMASQELKGLVGSMKSLPPLPSLYIELMKIIEDPNATGKTIGHVIAQDVSMTAKILQLSNSAFFGGRRSISDPAEAVVVLGLHTIRNLILTAHLFSHFEKAHLHGLSMEALWAHSLETSALARRLCRLEGSDPHTTDDAAAGGILHDVGKIVLAVEYKDDYDALLAKAIDEGRPLAAVETEALGSNHAEVGAYLLGIWGLPTMVVEAVAFHHDLRDYMTDRFSAVLGVYAANLLQHEIEDPSHQSIAWGLAPLTKLGLGHRLETWRQCSREAHSELQERPEAS
jgi:putative nucleotidyltransferase with HDIG domain